MYTPPFRRSHSTGSSSTMPTTYSNRSMFNTSSPSSSHQGPSSLLSASSSSSSSSTPTIIPTRARALSLLALRNAEPPPANYGNHSRMTSSLQRYHQAAVGVQTNLVPAFCSGGSTANQRYPSSNLRLSRDLQRRLEMATTSSGIMPQATMSAPSSPSAKNRLPNRTSLLNRTRLNAFSSGLMTFSKKL